jgi:hypothetical protein
MADIIDDEYMVCTDCLMVIANADYSGLDYHYSPAEAEQRRAAIDAGMDRAGGYICCGDSDRDLEFSRRGCDCCGSDLAGSLHHCIVLG